MSDTTGIEWTDATWNPTVGCTKVSAGCDHCYAETFVNRFAGHNAGFPNRFDQMHLRGERTLNLPIKWRKPRKIFVNSLSDLFHDDVPDEFIAEVFAVMAVATQHTFQLLTKRHARLRSLLNNDDFVRAVGQAWLQHPLRVTYTDYPGFPLPNVWVGVSVENQQWANIRIPALLGTPAAVRFLSCEPLLGPVDLAQAINVAPFAAYHFEPGGIDWVIAGGESGPGSRPMDVAWARSLRDQCTDAQVPFLFKQWGDWYDGERLGKKEAGRVLDGRTWDEYPAPVAEPVGSSEASA